jgi:hypothetical protein
MTFIPSAHAPESQFSRFTSVYEQGSWYKNLWTHGQGKSEYVYGGGRQGVSLHNPQATHSGIDRQSPSGEETPFALSEFGTGDQITREFTAREFTDHFLLNVKATYGSSSFEVEKRFMSQDLIDEAKRVDAARTEEAVRLHPDMPEGAARQYIPEFYGAEKIKYDRPGGLLLKG